MPYCIILECRNNSRNKNVSKGSVSYHRFPKDEVIKEQWINATGRVNWVPSQMSTVCSEHFLPSDMLITDKGYRYLRACAVPTVKIMKFLPKQNLSDAADDTTNHTISTFEKIDVENSGTPCRNEIARILINMIDAHSINSDTISSIKSKTKPKNQSELSNSVISIQKEKGQLRWFQEKLKEKDRKVRRLQEMNRKLRKKLTSTEEALKALQAKNGIKNKT